MDGNGLQRCLNDGCVVKNKSSVFSFLVGKSTKLFKEEVNGLRIKRRKYIFIIGGVFNLPDLCWSEQSIQTNP
jgi:hypothetical protein